MRTKSAFSNVLQTAELPGFSAGRDRVRLVMRSMAHLVTMPGTCRQAWTAC
jgi:hypothetical protein